MSTRARWMALLTALAMLGLAGCDKPVQAVPAAVSAGPIGIPPVPGPLPAPPRAGASAASAPAPMPPASSTLVALTGSRSLP